MNPNWNNVPFELRQLKQWVCTNTDKIPLNPVTKKIASPTDPKTWGTFQQACEAGMPAIGFIITAQDPYAFIDLDSTADPLQLERQTKIYESFNSYAERSVSGKGAHIIVKGRIPAGVRRDKVEVYSAERYMICTGDILRNSPINDYQALLNVLYAEMQSTAPTIELEETEADLSDEDIVDRAMRASNSDKFNSLCAGEISEYPSQSEADFALLSIIAFYTKSNEQVRRIFRMTKLGKREKAVKNNTYLDFALRKVRAQQPEPVDFVQAAANAEAIMRPKVDNTPPPSNTFVYQSSQISEGQPVPITFPKDDIVFPHGLVGEIAQYIYDSAFVQSKEIALTGALPLFGAFVGRQYNIGRQGLGQYAVVISEATTGKEAAASAINRIFKSLTVKNPLVGTFQGPGAFASSSGMARMLSENPSMVCVQSEFGFTLNRMINAKIDTQEYALRGLYLDAYTKNSCDSIMLGKSYSKTENNIAAVESPNLNIFGDSTAFSFFEGMSIASMLDGLLPRLLIIENKKLRPYANENHSFPPPEALIQKLSDVLATVGAMRNNSTFCHIPMDEETTAYDKKFGRDCTDLMNAHHGDAVYTPWGRAVQNTRRLAGLIAVGVNHLYPQVTLAEYKWAKQLVERSIKCLTARFVSGDIGEASDKQLFELTKAIESYFNSPAPFVKADPKVMKLHSAGIISHATLSKMVRPKACFSSAKPNALVALKGAVQELVTSGKLTHHKQGSLKASHDYSGEAYSIESHWG